jgi:hypothetical protein
LLSHQILPEGHQVICVPFGHANVATPLLHHTLLWLHHSVSALLIIVSPSDSTIRCIADYLSQVVFVSNNIPYCSGCIFDPASQETNDYWHYFHSLTSFLFSGFEYQLMILL